MDKLLEGLVIGVHLVSVHSVDHMNNNNPGLFVRAPAGVTLGFYENSTSGTRYAGGDRARQIDYYSGSWRKRISTYAAWTAETPGRTFALTVGVVSGYGRRRQEICVETNAFGCIDRETLQKVDAVIPLIYPSVRVPLTTSISARVAYSYLPSGSAPRPMHVGHLMLEWRFGAGGD